MATFGQIPSNINFSKMNIVADIAARDALTGMTQGDACFVTGLGDNGISYFYNGTSWVAVSGQLLQRVDLAANSSIILTPVPGFSELVIRYSIRGITSSVIDSVNMFLDGDNLESNYHYQRFTANDGTGPVLAEGAFPIVANVPSANSPTGAYGTGEIKITNYGETGRIKHVRSSFVALLNINNVEVGGFGMVHDAGSTGAIDTSIALGSPTSPFQFAAGSWAELWGY